MIQSTYVYFFSIRQIPKLYQIRNYVTNDKKKKTTFTSPFLWSTKDIGVDSKYLIKSIFPIKEDSVFFLNTRSLYICTSNYDM